MIIFLVLSSFVVMNLVIAVMCRSLYHLQQIEKQMSLSTQSSCSMDEEYPMPLASPSDEAKRREFVVNSIQSLVQQMDQFTNSQTMMQHKLNSLVTQVIKLNQEPTSSTSNNTLQYSISSRSEASCNSNRQDKKINSSYEKDNKVDDNGMKMDNKVDDNGMETDNKEHDNGMETDNKEHDYGMETDNKEDENCIETDNKEDNNGMTDNKEHDNSMQTEDEEIFDEDKINKSNHVENKETDDDVGGPVFT